ncbi:alpha-1,2-mannosyltransferase [Actinomadura pelletieri DSM 43383]|uniref:Alpha-1,2-mannosyltransferase n=1 Tax=Actinomadura pelletieri DSM 43383 TaxID=1120940 RepID=A0A495QXZ2_9ACTN|nr:glycosyltransferase 87 family protein [Actinomadura pelletieri]RKS79079.1 alpha-1,2-mannosyltransferase [Actinomadura pelletieri DSM 43383]
MTALAAYHALHGPEGVHGLDDLEVYLGAVESFKQGDGLYTFHSTDIGDGFTYPPFAAFTIIPLTFVPYTWAAVLWTCTCAACTVIIAVVVGRHIAKKWPYGVLDDSASSSGLVFLAISISAPLASNLRFGQISLLLCALVIVDVLCLGRTRAAGVLVGIATAIKLTPLIFIPLLWLAGRCRATVMAVGTFALCILGAWAVSPAESEKFWFSVVFQVDAVHAFTPSGNISLDASLQRLGLHGNAHTAIWAMLCLAVLVVAMYRAAQACRAGDHFAALVIVGAASLVVSPISWTHHQIWLVLAPFVVVRWPDRRWTAQAAWAAAVLAIMSLSLAEVRPLLAIAVAALVPFRKPADN